MSAPKWNSNDIIKFLEVYEKYELVWNIRDKEYLNKNKRELLFQKLVSELMEQGFENINVEVVRKKLKTLKTGLILRCFLYSAGPSSANSFNKVLDAPCIILLRIHFLTHVLFSFFSRIFCNSYNNKAPISCTHA